MNCNDKKDNRDRDTAALVELQEAIRAGDGPGQRLHLGVICDHFEKWILAVTGEKCPRTKDDQTIYWWGRVHDARKEVDPEDVAQTFRRAAVVCARGWKPSPVPFAVSAFRAMKRDFARLLERERKRERERRRAYKRFVREVEAGADMTPAVVRARAQRAEAGGTSADATRMYCTAVRAEARRDDANDWARQFVEYLGSIGEWAARQAVIDHLNGLTFAQAARPWGVDPKEVRQSLDKAKRLLMLRFGRLGPLS